MVAVTILLSKYTIYIMAISDHNIIVCCYDMDSYYIMQRILQNPVLGLACSSSQVLVSNLIDLGY